MERFKEFLRTKGLYMALSVGVVAVLGLMVAYNYDNYKKDFEKDKQTIDLNAPEKQDSATDNRNTNSPEVAQAKVDAPDSTEATSDGAVAGNTDANVKGDNQDNNENDNVNDNANETAVNEGKTFSDDAPEATNPELDERQQALAASTDPVIVDENGVMIAKCYDGESPLVWPVDGEVILPFSMDTTVYFKTLSCYRCNPGLLIAAEEGANVLAAYEGVVASITEDKEHGAMVTIDMGNGYKAIYGQLMNITVKENDPVTTAQNIGEIAPVSSYYAKEGNHLYFELQKDGEPVNPTIYMQ